MNKLILLFLFFFCSNAGAQDSLPLAKKEKIVFTEKDVVVDSAFVRLKPFAKNFKKKYTDEAFIYEFKTPEKNAWDRFKEWLANFFKNIFKFTDSKSATNFVDILLRVIAILIVLAVIYMIVKAIMNKEGQWFFGKTPIKKSLIMTKSRKIFI